MNNQARELMDEGIRLKKEGKLGEARVRYDQAIAHDLHEPILYYGLAKVNYLLGAREEAVSNYLRAAHLSYGQMREGMSQKSPAGEMAKEQLAELDPDLRSALLEVSDDAPLLMLDDNTARNLGHVLVDLGDQRPGEVEECLGAYQRSLKGDEELDEGEVSELARLDEALYLPVGREWLAENILWEMLGDLEVYKMY